MYSLQFNATYAPPEGDSIGGDWFDVFRLPDGNIFLAIGDAVGHGAAAASTMYDVRRALCAAAFAGAKSPSQMLYHASAELQKTNAEALASAFVGVVNERTGRLRYASAGHPPGLLTTANARVSLLHSSGSLLGYGLCGLHDEDVLLMSEALLVLYTDGLTEFSRNISEGERLLMNSAIAEISSPTPNPAASILHGTLGDARASDDIAVLTARTTTRRSSGSSLLREPELRRVWALEYGLL